MIFKIKHRYSGSALFSLECGSLKLCVEAAIKAKADLRGACLSWADLRGADLRGAYLRGADLRGADLGGAYLRGADLSWADLRGAYLRGAYLGGAYLRGACLSGARGLHRDLATPLRILLAQRGPLRAYKLVTADGVGPFNGGVKYEIGATVEIPDANTDETEQCAAGINVADLSWCLREWKEGYSVLIVEFAVADIACIPIASDGKFRLKRCRVVEELDLAAIGWPMKAEEGPK